MSGAAVPVLVVEDDPFPRVLQVILDPHASAERGAAFDRMIAHELPDFVGWCERVRRDARGLYPAEVRLVASQEELRANLHDASAVVVESFQIGREELAIARQLKAVQKYGTVMHNIDTAACAAGNVKVLTLRRRATSACAEHTFALMLALSRQLNRIAGRISVEQLTAAGYAPTSFDGKHVPTSGWARITGQKILRGSTLGILGLGEIGREVALRAAAFEMRVLYYQRNRLTESEHQQFHAQYAPLDALLSESDWVSVHLPLTPATRGFIGRAQLAKMKRGACLINISRAAIVERSALIEALESGHLGGFALDALYQEPGRADDELLKFENAILTPHTAALPRMNGLDDFNELIVGLSQALASEDP